MEKSVEEHSRHFGLFWNLLTGVFLWLMLLGVLAKIGEVLIKPLRKRNIERPDLRTLGDWLWKNDVNRLDSTSQAFQTLLYKEIKDSDVIYRHSTESLGPDVGPAIGYLTQLLSGGFLNPSYEPKPMGQEAKAAAKRARDAIVASRLPRDLRILNRAMIAGTVVAVTRWYEGLYDESLSICSHIISLQPQGFGDATSEAFRIRGITYLTIGRFDLAQADLEEAQRRCPGLVGIQKPLAAAKALQSQQNQ